MKRTPSMEQTVLDDIDRHPSIRVRAVTVAIERSRNWVLQREALHLHHLQKIEILLSINPPACVRFARWYLKQCAQNATFSFSVLFRMRRTSREVACSTNTMRIAHCSRKPPKREIAC